MNHMIAIGLDASTTCTGYSVFDNGELVTYGCIKPGGEKWRYRLLNEGPMLRQLFEQWNPDIVYMENVPLVNRQMETLVILGAVQGYIIGIASSLGINIEFLYPNTWRKEVQLFDGTRKGETRDAMKEKAVNKANELFGLELQWVKPKSIKNQDDIAEAILIAYSKVKS